MNFFFTRIHIENVYLKLSIALILMNKKLYRRTDAKIIRFHKISIAFSDAMIYLHERDMLNLMINSLKNLFIGICSDSEISKYPGDNLLMLSKTLQKAFP